MCQREHEDHACGGPKPSMLRGRIGPCPVHARLAHGHPVQCYQGEGKRGSLKCPCCGGQPLPSWHPNPSLEWGGGIGQTGRPSPAWGPPQAGGDWRPAPPLIYYYIEPNGTNPRPRVLKLSQALGKRIKMGPRRSLKLRLPSLKLRLRSLKLRLPGPPWALRMGGGGVPPTPYKSAALL